MVKTLERWHVEREAILVHNRTMKSKNVEFEGIAKSVVMLPLNAAIEAARAGEHGRGFAVAGRLERQVRTRHEHRLPAGSQQFYRKAKAINSNHNYLGK